MGFSPEGLCQLPAIQAAFMALALNLPQAHVVRCAEQKELQY